MKRKTAKRKFEFHNVFLITTVIIVVLFIGLTSFIVGCYCWELSNGEKGISALQGKKIADTYAFSWCSGASLLTIDCGEMIKDGYFSSIRYEYWNNTDSSNNSLEITVDNHFNTVCRVGGYQRHRTPVSDSITDSPEIFSNFRSNSEVDSFLSVNGGYAENFYLYYDVDYNTTVWYIHWYSGGFMDDPHSISALFNASTGATIKVGNGQF